MKLGTLEEGIEGKCSAQNRSSTFNQKSYCPLLVCT